MEEYKLFGFLNMFKLIPDFVFPVYEQENVLYIQEGERNKLCAIAPLKKELCYRVVPKSEYTNFNCLARHLNITITSSPKYAFQISEKDIIYGDSKVILEYLEQFHSNDEILKQEIADFRDDVGYITVNKLKRKSNILQFYGTGRRKSSVARVYLRPGTGKIEINRRDIDEYFGVETLKVIVKQPLVITNTTDKLDVMVNVQGGGYTGQAGAIRHGISRALLQVDTNYRPVLKKAGFLTRDSRMKERKKYGLKSARRASQFSKR